MNVHALAFFSHSLAAKGPKFFESASPNIDINSLAIVIHIMNEYISQRYNKFKPYLRQDLINRLIYDQFTNDETSK